jgi:hypothetical protein
VIFKRPTANATPTQRYGLGFKPQIRFGVRPDYRKIIQLNQIVKFNALYDSASYLHHLMASITRHQLPKTHD